MQTWFSTFPSYLSGFAHNVLAILVGSMILKQVDGTPVFNLKDTPIPPNLSSWQWQIALLISSCPKIDFDLLALLNYRSAYLILVVCFDLMRPLALLTVFSSVWAKCVNGLAACVADSALLLNLKPGRPWSILTSTRRSGPIQFDFPQKNTANSAHIPSILSHVGFDW